MSCVTQTLGIVLILKAFEKHGSIGWDLLGSFYLHDRTR